MRHFLKETDFSHDEIRDVFQRCVDMKAQRRQTPRVLSGESWGMLFYKNSTRTRVSFEVGIHELGGNPLVLSATNTQISRGESNADTARVLSRYLYGLVIRCYGHDVLESFAKFGSIPIVNALSDFLHPCQIYADLFSIAEKYCPGSQNAEELVASLKGKKLAFLGDTACNMANSWLLGGAHFGMQITLAGPASFAPEKAIRDQLKADGYSDTIHHFTDPLKAVEGADVVYTDVWVSMGAEDDEAARIKEMQPYSVNHDIMAAAAPGALFMHCLPAHPGMEVTQEVLDSTASIIFDEAENRLHMQKAILAKLAELR